MSTARRIDDPEVLGRLLDALLCIEGDLGLPALLQHLVDEARALTGARYAALGVLDEDRAGLSEFLTSGLSPDEVDRIGPWPTGRGVLGLLVSDPRPLRLADVTTHPERVGFPPGHPAMRSFLGVPVGVHDQVFAHLYVAEKAGGTEFTVSDEEVLVTLARAGGVAIETSWLHRRAQEVAALEERERDARDLHDAVIQRLFAIGLSLHGVSRAEVPVEAAERVQRAVGDLDDTIRRIRSSIFVPDSTSHASVRASVLALVEELRPVVGCDISVVFDGPVDSGVTRAVSEHLPFVIREALSDVGRHAGSTRAWLRVSVHDGGCAVTVSDDGQVDAAHGDGGGSQSLRRRAERLGGDMSVEETPSGGTRVVWRVPYTS